MNLFEPAEFSQSCPTLSMRVADDRVRRVAPVGARLYYTSMFASMPRATGTEAVVLVLGVGNAMKGDDGFGPLLVNLLLERGAAVGTTDEFRDGRPRIVALDCGTTPENYTSVIRRLQPGMLLIVDAAEMGLRAGECRIIARDRIGSLGLSTHSMPLTLFMSYVDDLVERIALVGVQPHSMALGAEMSPEVAAAADNLAECLVRGGLEDLPVLA